MIELVRNANGADATAGPMSSVCQKHELTTGPTRPGEQLGYYSIWGNDHLSTPQLIRATQQQPPNFYEPIVTFASLATVTERLRFMLGILVLPERDPVLLA